MHTPSITDRIILIDNATLSGVERMTGMSKILNLNYIDNDILCLEKVLTAILFSDRLITVDDYKSEYRSSRLKNFDFVDFRKIDEVEYQNFSRDAASFAKEMSFSIDGSKPSGDVVSFFEALKIDPQLRWNVFVSSEYLTLSYLLKDKKDDQHDRMIDSAFRQEDTDRKQVEPDIDPQPKFSVLGHSSVQDVTDFIHRLMSKNSASRGGDKGTLERMVFGYGWAAERSHFYNSVAANLGADVYLAPLRDAFCESCCRIDYRSDILGLLENLKNKSHDTISAILEPGGQSRFVARLPFFAASLLSKTDNPSQCIDLALSLRNRQEFQEARTIFHNLQHVTPEVRRSELNGIFEYLEQSCSKLMKKYAVETPNGLQFSLSIGLSGPTMGVSGKINTLFRAYKNRPFSRIFRTIAQDMINVERLGQLYEKACSQIQKHGEATTPRISTTPKFMENRQSQYGRPATLD